MDDKCQVVRTSKEVIVDETVETQVATLYITGMGCVNCANRVYNSLIAHPGVVKAEVSHVNAQADVTYIPAKVDVSLLLNLVEAAGDNRHSYWVEQYLLITEVHNEHYNHFDCPAHTTPITKARTLDS